jgi:hypothetical protein
VLFEPGDGMAATPEPPDPEEEVPLSVLTADTVYQRPNSQAAPGS